MLMVMLQGFWTVGSMLEASQPLDVNALSVLMRSSSPSCASAVTLKTWNGRHLRRVALSQSRTRHTWS